MGRMGGARSPRVGKRPGAAGESLDTPRALSGCEVSGYGVRVGGYEGGHYRRRAYLPSCHVD